MIIITVRLLDHPDYIKNSTFFISSEYNSYKELLEDEDTKTKARLRLRLDCGLYDERVCQHRRSLSPVELFVSCLLEFGRRASDPSHQVHNEI